MRPRSAAAALALGSLAVLDPSYSAAAENEDVAELRRLLREVQAQNRELSRRLSVLESTREAPAPQTRTAARARSQPASDASPSPAAASPPDARPLPEPRDTSKMSVPERVKELETAWAAQESATRQIIRDSFAKAGPKINSNIAMSGVVELVGSRTRDFGGPIKDQLLLGTTELDFDIKLSDWLTGAVVMSWESGTNPVFPITTVTSAGAIPAIDRFTLDRTHVAIGDFTQFPIGARFGREVLHFGTSTGVARLDTLSIGTPLTTEVFENRQVAGGLEFAWPVPPLGPPPAPVVVPRSEPLVVAPAVSGFMRWLGYKPLPQKILPPAPVRPAANPSPFYGSILAYKGSEIVAPDKHYLQDFNASLGFRTSGHCGLPYEQLRSSWVCPWTLDAHVDYNTSVFDSRFLEASYRPFLSQIGKVPGVAGSVKASFGPFAVVGEVNKALESVSFFDGLGVLKTMQPMTWQASIAYQFDWNPWITEIGHQGNFLSLAYSGSKDMAGATDVINGVPTRIGFVPQHRLLVTAGEWPMDGLRLAVEYAANWDYSVSEGGTGQLAHGVFGSVQLNF
jgi:hypothetical protein